MDDVIFVLPDGSACFTSSMPLPKDHWLYEVDSEGNMPPPPMTHRMGTSDPRRKEWEAKIRAAAEHAARYALGGGQFTDPDPDCFVQAMIVGMLGYHTADGLGSEPWQNPSPVPSSVK